MVKVDHKYDINDSFSIMFREGNYWIDQYYFDTNELHLTKFNHIKATMDDELR